MEDWVIEWVGEWLLLCVSDSTWAKTNNMKKLVEEVYKNKRKINRDSRNSSNDGKCRHGDNLTINILMLLMLVLLWLLMLWVWNDQ